MHLITFAHWPEARAFFDHFSPVRHPKFDWLYEFKNGVMIITGEGIHEAISKTTLCLGMFSDISAIFNFGVAGILGNDLELHEVKEIRTCYAFDQRPLFKSFTLSGDTDLVTSGERILSESQANPLKTMATVVDREAWGIAFAAKEARLPLRSFKYLSDKSGELGACELVKEMADSASTKLLETYLSIGEDKGSEVLKMDGFYFTFTQEKQLQTLLKKLSIKFDRAEDSWTSSQIVTDLRTEKILPKERTKKFLLSLVKELDPFSFLLQEKIEDTFSPLTHEKISITPLNQMETPELKVQFIFHSPEDLLEKTQILKNFKWKDYYNLRDGNIN